MSDTETRDETPQARQVLTRLGEHVDRLDDLLAAQRANLEQIAVGNFGRPELMLEDWPEPGARRAIAQRTGSGFDALTVPTAPADVAVLIPHSGRMGGIIVNSGAAACVLYLVNQGMSKPGRPAIWLPAGANWNMRLGVAFWAGAVTAMCPTGTTTLTVAEV